MAPKRTSRGQKKSSHMLANQRLRRSSQPSWASKICTLLATAAIRFWPLALCLATYLFLTSFHLSSLLRWVDSQDTHLALHPAVEVKAKVLKALKQLSRDVLRGNPSQRELGLKQLKQILLAEELAIIMLSPDHWLLQYQPAQMVAFLDSTKSQGQVGYLSRNGTIFTKDKTQVNITDEVLAVHNVPTLDPNDTHSQAHRRILSGLAPLVARLPKLIDSQGWKCASLVYLDLRGAELKCQQPRFEVIFSHDDIERQWLRLREVIEQSKFEGKKIELDLRDKVYFSQLVTEEAL